MRPRWETAPSRAECSDGPSAQLATRRGASVVSQRRTCTLTGGGVLSRGEPLIGRCGLELVGNRQAVTSALEQRTGSVPASRESRQIRGALRREGTVAMARRKTAGYRNSVSNMMESSLGGFHHRGFMWPTRESICSRTVAWRAIAT